MFKEIFSIALKFIILWFTSVIIIQTGIYFWSFIENKIITDSSFNYKNWSDKLESSSAIMLCILSVGLYIKLKFPPKNTFLYFLRWGLLYIIFPLTIG